MATDHARNMESLARPAVALGLAVAAPVMAVFAPFIVAGIAIWVAFVFMGWTWDAAMLPFARGDEALDDMIVKRFGAGGAIWGASALFLVTYVAINAFGWWHRDWPPVNLRLIGCLALAYAAIVGTAGAVNGTHFGGQVAYAWSHPGRSSTLAWNCPASVAEGKAERTGRYDFLACQSYVDQAAMRGACRQVMRSMRPLSGPTVMCSSHIRAITQHEWPVDGWAYKEWDTSFRVPVRNLPLATPERMRMLLGKEGLTPRTT